MGRSSSSSSSGMSRSGPKRLAQELASFDKLHDIREERRSQEYYDGLELDTRTDGIDHEFDAIERMGLVDESLVHWYAVLNGSDDTAYQGGRWKLDIKVPEAYPNEPPRVTFVTPICHPNVDFKTGEICLDLLKTAWSPVYTLSKTILAVHQLLSAPAPDSPLNVDIAILMRSGDYMAAEGLIRYYTRLYRYHD